MRKKFRGVSVKKFVVTKIDRKTGNNKCIICKKNVRRGIAFKIYYDLHREELVFHSSCFLALVKKLFPKDVRISRRMKDRAVVNLI